MAGRLASAGFWATTQYVSYLINPQRRHGFSPLIDSLARNAKRGCQLADRTIEFLDGIGCLHAQNSKRTSIFMSSTFRKPAYTIDR